MSQTQKENFIIRTGKKLGGWVNRAVLGGKWKQTDEEIESPSKLLREKFFRKKGAVVALILLVCLFLFVLIAPVFLPMDENYTDPLQQNIAPVYSLRKVPKKLKNSVREINGFSGFTVGLSESGEPFVWGSSKDKLKKTDLKDIPKEVLLDGVAYISAGKDHILALTKSGKLIGWGDNSCGQYGFEPVLNALTAPEELKSGIAPEKVKSLVCGYQVSALVTSEHKAFVWGNINAVRNLPSMQNLEKVQEIAFTNSTAVALLSDGKITTGSERVFTSLVTSKGVTSDDFDGYTRNKRVVAIATTNKCLALLTDEHELMVTGVFENGEEQLPVLEDGEYFTQIDGGTRHFVGVTNLGNAYAWGHNAYKQCDLQKDGKTVRVFAGSIQSYTIDGDGKLLQSVGLKGYPLGTDGRGRDEFTRIVHGGKMTMTIGAVAVLVSSVIAVIIGCVSGYFGGVVDTILMRITEIFSSIPFLPFAMLLSQIIKNYNIPENTRIFIIMLILGALSWTGLARMIRGQILVEREKEFVLSARAIGVKERTIAFRHVLPNVASVILVSMTLDFAGCLLTESSLSYLGFGVQQPKPTWGNMLTGCNNSTIIQNYWWQWLFPALFLSLATICINIVGDALRDALDPKSSLEK